LVFHAEKDQLSLVFLSVKGQTELVFELRKTKSARLTFHGAHMVFLSLKDQLSLAFHVEKDQTGLAF
jgi:hypothetical protein